MPHYSLDDPALLEVIRAEAREGAANWPELSEKELGQLARLLAPAPTGSARAFASPSRATFRMAGSTSTRRAA